MSDQVAPETAIFEVVWRVEAHAFNTRLEIHSPIGSNLIRSVVCRDPQKAAVAHRAQSTAIAQFRCEAFISLGLVELVVRISEWYTGDVEVLRGNRTEGPKRTVEKRMARRSLNG